MLVSASDDFTALAAVSGPMEAGGCAGDRPIASCLKQTIFLLFPY
jgi:poly(3-hydroxybutyrate) depolymerase